MRLIVQPALEREGEPDHVALFLLSAGALGGPALYSTMGMRLHNEQSGSSSLYTHPFALEAVPLDDRPVKASRDVLDERLSIVVSRA